MSALSAPLRRQLERAVLAARTAAETGAGKALRALGVDQEKASRHLTNTQVELHRRLRAQAHMLGDGKDLKHLIEKIAYDHWHRLLFSRFLLENHMLLHPEHRVPLEFQDIADLATEAGIGEPWDLAARYTASVLPAIFRPDDPVGDISLPSEDRGELLCLLKELPTEIFQADDSLGWVYQFWRAAEKDAVNRSGDKIGADELPAVTQLFTEDYMVDFLLDNTLGAWHAGKAFAANPKLAASAKSEEELRQAVALPGCPWKYLRFTKGKDGKWTPAAGTFDGWPRTAKELKCLDPCMGSGHFVVAMFQRLVALRMAEEKLDEAAAVASVIRDNLFGLEIDPRCTQIGAFNLALAAWRRVGHRPLPAMNLACSGLAPNTREVDWLAIAGDNEKLQRGLERLYRLFQKAAVLGSLINPRAGESDLLVAAFHELQPLLEKALSQETKDDTAHEMAVTAQGLAKAAEILAAQFTLVATNVPYLTRGKQCDELGIWADNYADDAKFDLATIFTMRCLDFLAVGAAAAVVVPQNWLALKSFAKLRGRLLTEYEWRMLVKLGPAAFSDMNWWAANTALLVFTKGRPNAASFIAGVDASLPRRIHQKEILLQGGSIDLGESDRADKSEKGSVDGYAPDEHFGSFAQTADGEVYCPNQLQQMKNHGAVVVFGKSAGLSELAEFATVHYGFKPGQTARVTRCFWEQKEVSGSRWQLMESTPGYNIEYSGKSEVCMRPDEMRQQGITEFGESGVDAWRHKGIIVAKMGRLPHSIYCGELFDDNTYVLLPKRSADLSAIWAFITSGDFFREVRGRNQKVAVDTGSMIHIPFDLAHWQKAAAKKYPHGLPKPLSSDPTQWLFNGHPKGADQPLHVAVVRLLGYQWPRQTGSSFPDCPALGPDGLEAFADTDGIVCVNAIKGESAAAERLRQSLDAAYGDEWSAERLSELLAPSGARSLEDWLRNHFFEEHCAIFHQRPFLWQIWDGRKDGFSAIANYHRLDRATLEKLTYAYLGDWLRRQQAAKEAGEAGSDARHQAAVELQTKLKLIIEGEQPYDIFVRWKPIDKQPLGWAPDLNDGVRLNIRPFVTADILRKRPNINWRKDRGKDVTSAPWHDVFGGERINDHHLTLEEKRAARLQAETASIADASLAH